LAGLNSRSVIIKISDSVAIPRTPFTAIAESELAVTSATVSTAFTVNRTLHKCYSCCYFEGYYYTMANISLQIPLFFLFGISVGDRSSWTYHHQVSPS